MRKARINVGIIGVNHGLKTILPAIRASSKVGEIFLAASENSIGKSLEVDGKRLPLKSVHEILSMNHVKAIFVASPPATHLNLVLKSLATGKAVYCEKPGGVQSSELELMINSSKTQSTPLVIGFQYRYDPYIQFIKNFVQQFQLETIQRINVNWATSSGLFATRQDWKMKKSPEGSVSRDFLPHVFDYLDFCVPQLFIGGPSSIEILKSQIRYDEVLLLVRANQVLLDIRISRLSKENSVHEIEVLDKEFVLRVNRFSPYGMRHAAIQVNGMSLNRADFPGFTHQLEELQNRIGGDSNLQIFATSVLINKFLDGLHQKNGNWMVALERSLYLNTLLDKVLKSIQE
jgi:predicted dehydrogenase